MSKKQRIAEDPIVQEVRDVRETLAAESGNDIEKFCRKIMGQQKTSKHRYVSPRKRRKSNRA